MSDARDYPLLSLQGEFLNDMEAMRIANANRVRAMQEDLGIISGPEVEAAEAMGDLLNKAERAVIRDLTKALKQTPLAEWVKGTCGIGEKTAARLLACIGHPCWRYDSETEDWKPRTVGQLWSYCGYGDARAQVRRKGVQSNWSDEAKKRVYLLAESCIKQAKSPYRVVYDEGRERYADAVHAAECRRCGPKGKPAQPGLPLSDGHKHMRAMRLMSKAILKDMWIVAKEQETSGRATDSAKPTNLALAPSTSREEVVIAV